MLRSIVIYSLLLLNGLSHSVSAQQYLRLSECEVTFLSVAELEIIKASTNEVAGILDPAGGKFAFKIAMKTFDGFNNPKQRLHFQEKFIETIKFPDAQFEGKVVDQIDLAESNEQLVRVKGILTVHGKTVEKLIKVKLLAENGMLRFKASFPVYLDDHDIKVPKIVRYNIADEINVDVNGTFSFSE